MHEDRGPVAGDRAAGRNALQMLGVIREVLRAGARGEGEQHGKEHQARAVGGSHQEGPQRKLAASDAHSHPARMGAGLHELEEPEGDEGQRSSRAEGTRRRDALHASDHGDDEGDGHGMAEGDGKEGLQDGLAPPLLQADRHGEEPAHPRIHAVVGAEKDERHPRPRLGHG